MQTPWSIYTPSYGIYILECYATIKQVLRAGTSNYIPQFLWDVITCPCPWYLEAISILSRCRVTSIGIPMLKIRRSCDCLISNMGIPIPGKTIFILRWGSASGTTVLNSASNKLWTESLNTRHPQQRLATLWAAVYCCFSLPLLWHIMICSASFVCSAIYTYIMDWDKDSCIYCIIAMIFCPIHIQGFTYPIADSPLHVKLRVRQVDLGKFFVKFCIICF